MHSKLRERVKEIYTETMNTVKVEETETEKFWAMKELRQRCPADIEETFGKGQDGRGIIGQTKM